MLYSMIQQGDASADRHREPQKQPAVEVQAVGQEETVAYQSMGSKSFNGTASLTYQLQRIPLATLPDLHWTHELRHRWQWRGPSPSLRNLPPKASFLGDGISCIKRVGFALLFREEESQVVQRARTGLGSVN